jgi:hypothetical protein
MMERMNPLAVGFARFRASISTTSVNCAGSRVENRCQSPFVA